MKLFPDANTIAHTDGTDALRDAIDHGIPLSPADSHEDDERWPEPTPLADGLLPVAAFQGEFLPVSIAPWVSDISDRMQCPPDFVGVSAVVALGAILGRKIGIRPQRQTDWLEVANLWACIIGRPGAMKSPAMGEALKPLNRLESLAREANCDAQKEFEREKFKHKLLKEDAEAKARAALKKGNDLPDALLELNEPEAPKGRRYITNDATYEALGVILADNPNGVLGFRDELVSLLKTLDREDNAAARGFFLTAWNGTSGYTFDRIIRGKTHIDAACLSLLGSTQPGRIADYMRRAIAGGAGDDGLIQRFGLLVWPDQSPEWRDVDRYPDTSARTTAWNTFSHVDGLTPEAVGAERDAFDTIPFVRLDNRGWGLFAEWRADLEARLRSGGMHPALESHLAKYRKLVPALALINHVADMGGGAISERSVMRACRFADYLETHARRAYGAGSEAETTAAKAILSRIRRGDLPERFTARDIHRRDWSNLAARDQIQAGLDLLVDFDWLAENHLKTGGRPKVLYAVNPQVLR